MADVRIACARRTSETDLPIQGRPSIQMGSFSGFFFFINLTAAGEPSVDKWMKNETMTLQKETLNENIICFDLNYAHTWIVWTKDARLHEMAFTVSQYICSANSTTHNNHNALTHSWPSSMSANGLQLLLNRCLGCEWCEMRATSFEARRTTQCTDLEREQQQIEMETIKTSSQEKL